MADSLNSDSVEIWKPVPGLEGLYEVSPSLGAVRSLDRFVYCGRGAQRFAPGKAIKPHIVKGYLHVCLRAKGQYFNFYLHTLICEAANGPRPSVLHVVRHLNGDCLDNRPANLAWDTIRDNHADTISHGRTTRGVKNTQAILSEHEVVEIRRRGGSGEKHGAIAKDYGITPSNVSAILRRKSWGWLEG